MGWTDQQLLSIPYARLQQEKRVIDAARQTRKLEVWQQQAFVGWQVVNAMGGKVGSFSKYLRKLGLNEQPQLSREQVQHEKNAAFKALDLVEKRFDRKDTK